MMIKLFADETQRKTKVCKRQSTAMSQEINTNRLTRKFFFITTMKK